MKDAGTDARAIVGAEVAGLTKALSAEGESVDVLSERAIECGLGTGWAVTLRVIKGKAHLRQIAACFVLGPVAVLAHASMGELERREAEPRLLRILESLSAAL